MTQATIPTTIEGYNFTQDATITRINAQDIVNQLFSKTTFTALSSDFKYICIFIVVCFGNYFFIFNIDFSICFWN